MTTCPKCHGIHTLITHKFCPECGESLLELPKATIQTTDADAKKATRELEYWRCEAKNWRDVAEKLQQQADAKVNTGTDCGKSTTVNTGESFTTAQMVAAIGHWLQFGERMLAMNQHSGYFSGSGWAARALAAARDFIEKADRA